MTSRIVLFMLLVTMVFAPRKAHCAPLPVIDHNHIALNATHHTLDYIEQIVQVLKLVRQIQQLGDYLDRFGQPKLIVDLSGVDELLADLSASGLLETTATIVEEVSGSGVFDYEGLGVFEAIGDQFVIDEEAKVERDPSQYKAEDAAQKTFERYRSIQESVLERRETLKAAVASTSASLQVASTASEVQKLTGVLIGLQTELRTVDQELAFASMENAARLLENDNQQRVIDKANAERDAAKLTEGNKRDQKFYKPFSKPVYFSNNN